MTHHYRKLTNVNYILEISKSDEDVKNPREKVKSARPLIGASKCTFGPSYWCTDDQTMLECNVNNNLNPF